MATRSPQLVHEIGAAEMRLLDWLGREFEGGLVQAQRYLPEATAIAALVFPPAVAELTMASTAVDLLQRSIVLVEQGYAARGKQKRTGTQKLAEVVALSSSAVQGLLADPAVAAALQQHGITLSPSMIGVLTSDIVGVLNASSPSNPALQAAA